jgi:sporulation protein YlmC with PRC-barrel domain
MRLELGKRVRCSDGIAGELADVVVDPTTKKLTHLVLQPHHEHGEARLVPVALAAGDDASGDIVLRCTVAEAQAYERIEGFTYLRATSAPVEDPDWDVGIETLLVTPYYDASGLDVFPGPVSDGGMIYDRVPKGEVEIRRSSPVESADGHHLGHVEAFLVDADDGITHIVLERGHLWGKRDVTIPISAVAKTANDLVELRLTKDEVGDLPSVPVRRWH